MRMRMVAFPLLISTLFPLGGCAALSQRPTKPGQAKLEEHITDPATGQHRRRMLTLVNDENAKAPMAATLDGMSVNTGGSTPLKFGKLATQPLVWGGILLFLVGLGLLWVASNPIGGFVVKPGIGYLAMAAGLALPLAPFLFESVAPGLQVAIIIFALGAVGLGIWYAVKIARKEREDRQWDQDMLARERDLLIDGDTRAAGAIRYVRTGNRAEAKMVAHSGAGNGNAPAKHERERVA
jgi:hypothetical protein